MVLRSETPGAAIDILATNIRGMGAVQLVASLLPALERVIAGRLARVWLPDEGAIAHYAELGDGRKYRRYRRVLPNAISRILECTILSARLGHNRTVLTLGDLPLRHAARQVVFVQTPFLLGDGTSPSISQNLKRKIIRSVFRANLRSINAAIVQTERMRTALIAVYPGLEGKVHVIGQPAPQWLLEAPARAIRAPDQKLRLFYPAASYPHKNHALIFELASTLSEADPIASITVTIDAPAGSGEMNRLSCLGPLQAGQMIDQYAACDALVFPSLEESYGLPLVEAMFLGLPIVAADLPYAHELCGDEAVYFDPHSVEALRAAIATLGARLATGWRPDWSSRLTRIPRNWDEVAQQMLVVIDDTAD